MNVVLNEVFPSLAPPNLLFYPLFALFFSPRGKYPHSNQETVLSPIFGTSTACHKYPDRSTITSKRGLVNQPLVIVLVSLRLDTVFSSLRI